MLFFLEFINRVPFYGSAILCLDQENIQELIPKVEKRFMTYGIETKADLTATDINIDGDGSSYTVLHHNKPIGKISIRLPGTHNVANSLAAVAVGLELDVSFKNIAKALRDFPGIHHRLLFSARSFTSV